MAPRRWSLGAAVGEGDQQEPWGGQTGLRDGGCWYPVLGRGVWSGPHAARGAALQAAYQGGRRLGRGDHRSAVTARSGLLDPFRFHDFARFVVLFRFLNNFVIYLKLCRMLQGGK